MILPAAPARRGDGSRRRVPLRPAAVATWLGVVAALAATQASLAQVTTATTASAPHADQAGSEPTLTPAKRRLLARAVALQQSAVEAGARGLVEQSLAGIVQGGRQLLQTQVPPERRDATAREMDIEVRRYREEMTPLVRERAIRIAPEVLGPKLDATFSESELRQLIAWLESPVQKKYQAMTLDLQSAFTQRLLAESRSAFEPRLNQLGERLARIMGLPPASPMASAPSGAAVAPAAPASPAAASAATARP